MSEPTQFFAGSTVEWEKSLDDYTPDDGWTLNYRFLGPKNITVAEANITDDGTTWTVAIPAVTTIDYPAGNYTLYGWVTNDAGESHKVSEVKVEIKADFRTTNSPHDPRSIVKKTLDAIDAAILGIASREEQSYSINVGGRERTLELCSRAELITMRSHYARLYADELTEDKINAGQAGGRRILCRFKSP